MRGTGDTNTPSWLNNQLVEGTPVFDSNNDKVGTLQEFNQQEGYLLVQKGIFFPKDVYIPLDAVTNADTNGVYLNGTKDQFSSDTYSQPPTRDRWTTTDTTQTVGASNLTQTTGYDTTRSDLTTDVNANRNDIGRTQDNIAVPVREEELVARKQQEQIGEVRLHKDVTQEQQTLNIPVTHEEVHVERVDVNRPIDANAADAFQERDIDVPVYGERVEAGKQTMETGEVRLRKDQVTEQQRVADTVRREQVNIDGNPPDLIDNTLDDTTNQSQR